ncbi:MAG TPA: VOC family protein [Nitrososphaera sp.]|nr:VOC family protein [Nitrososphaera sp.]
MTATDRQLTNPSQITPMLSVDDVKQAVEFYKQIGLHSIMEIKGPNGELVRAILQLGTGSLIHVMPAHALHEEGERGLMIERGPRGLGVILYVNVNDLDTFYNAARKAGIDLMYTPRDESWGDRTFRFVDPFGYDWCFAQRIDKMNKP